MFSNTDLIAMTAAYNAGQTTKEVAAHFNMKEADVRTVLRLAGVKLRRGSPLNNLTSDARAKGMVVRKQKALARRMKKMIDSYGLEAVEAAYTKEAGI